MIERDVLVTTKHGSMPSFAVYPESSEKLPPIIFYMDAPGIREELRNMARRVANGGYFCLLPDLYYRLGTVRLDVQRRNDAMSSVIAACRLGLTNEQIVDDTAGMLAFLDAQGAVRPGPVGCVGYCFSGQFVMTVAARYAHRMAAIVSLYGTNIITDKEDSPHKLLGDIGGEIYFGFAENDKSISLQMVDQLRSALDAAGVTYAMDVYPGTQHGFCFPNRDIYNSAAAEGAWAKSFALWDRVLKRAGG